MTDPAATQIHADEFDRLRQHATHEERLFHDRMNFFSGMQVGMLGVFAILYNERPSQAVFVPLIAVALAFTLIWFVVQVRHWRCCVHVHVLVRGGVPEEGRTVASLATPLLFAALWVALLIRTFVRSRG